MSEELMSLAEIERLKRLIDGESGYKDHSIGLLCKTARAAHSLQERLRTSTQALIEIVGADGPASFEDVVKGVATLKEESEKLRAVYEAARRVLRFNGVDNQRTIEAVNDLDDAIEAMKAADVGNGEGFE